MRVGYDVRLLAASTQPSGIGQYAIYLISEMRKLATVELFSDRHLDMPPGLQGLPLHVLPQVPAWQQTVFPWALRRHRVDVFHGLAFTLPLWDSCSRVVTIHDMGFALAQDTVASDVRRYLSLMAPRAIAQGEAIIVPSVAVREDFVRVFPQHRTKVFVVPLGVDPRFVPPSADRDKGTIRAELGEDRPYLLAVGSQEPRKNLQRLVTAFLEMIRQENLPHRLLLVGRHGPSTADIKETVEQEYGSRVRILGYLPQERLVRYYQGADAFVFPSLFEGFGIPLLEAMATGCPMIVSDRPCMPEVAGEAAVYFDPLDVREIRTAMLRVLSDQNLRRQLLLRGLLKVKEYSWERCAQETLGIYEVIAT